MIKRLLRSSKFWLLVILLLAAILRLYRLPEYLQFLGDQGRDVLAVKRMIVDHEWTLLGPTASVGGFYIGALYYYFMLPFLWLFNLDPTGPAVMQVLFGLGTIILSWQLVRKFFNERAALITAFLMTISPKMVDISRFSWNPNPMPFFALLTIYALYQSVVSKKKIYTFIAGISLGVLFELHYIDLAFAPIVGVAMLLIFPLRELWQHVILISLGFFLGNSPFIIFEVRHDFPNTHSAWEFITRGGKTVAPRSFNLLWLENDITRILYEIVLGFRGRLLNIIMYSSLVATAYWVFNSLKKSHQKTPTILLLCWFLIGVFGVGSYQGHLLDHYFGYLFPLPFIFLGLTGNYLFTYKWLRPVLVIGLTVTTYFSVLNMYFWSPPNNQVQQTKNIDNIVLSLVGNQPYNFALITPGNSDHAYRYFLEIWHRSPLTIENPQIDPGRLTVTNQLIVVCESNVDCHPLGSPLWEVAGFGRADIVQTIVGPAGIRIFKLIHYKGI